MLTFLVNFVYYPRHMIVNDVSNVKNVVSFVKQTFVVANDF